MSDESGTDQIYVQAYPGPGERHTVSVDGGSEPLWSRNGGELFYRNADAMLSVSVTTTTASRISLGQPRKLFEGAYLRDTSNARAHPNYDVTADGRFLMLAAPPLSNARLVVVEDWFEELKRLAPAR